MTDTERDELRAQTNDFYDKLLLEARTEERKKTIEYARKRDLECINTDF